MFVFYTKAHENEGKNILDFPQFNLEKLHKEKTAFDLRKTLNRVFNLLLNQAEQKKMKFEIIYDGNIPKKIIGDKIKIKQILLNYKNQMNHLNILEA